MSTIKFKPYTFAAPSPPMSIHSRKALAKFYTNPIPTIGLKSKDPKYWCVQNDETRRINDEEVKMIRQGWPFFSFFLVFFFFLFANPRCQYVHSPSPMIAIYPVGSTSRFTPMSAAVGGQQLVATHIFPSNKLLSSQKLIPFLTPRKPHICSQFCQGICNIVSQTFSTLRSYQNGMGWNHSET